MGDPQLAADVAGPHSLLRELYNPLSHNVGQWSPVDEETSELVDSAVTWTVRALVTSSLHQSPSLPNTS